jgi:hypothetical protein
MTKLPDWYLGSDGCFADASMRRTRLLATGTSQFAACYSDNIVLETPCNSGKNVKKVLLYAITQLTRVRSRLALFRTARAARGCAARRVLILVPCAITCGLSGAALVTTYRKTFVWPEVRRDGIAGECRVAAACTTG